MNPLLQITQFLGLLALIQGGELLVMSRTWSERGVWRWNSLAPEIGSGFRLLLGASPFTLLNSVRIAAAFIAVVNPNVIVLGVLLVAHVLTMIRWLGSYNGGSDYMASLLLLFTFIGLLFPDSMATVCLWYITFQLCLSYFKAGLVKIRKEKWRRGEAISKFVLSPIYERDPLTSRIFESKSLSLVISWVTMIFELTFPLALLDQRIAIAYMSVAVIFHLGNAYVFGLNRFVFAWIAAYPALYWCAS